MQEASDVTVRMMAANDRDRDAEKTALVRELMSWNAVVCGSERENCFTCINSVKLLKDLVSFSHFYPVAPIGLAADRITARTLLSHMYDYSARDANEKECVMSVIQHFGLLD